MKAIGIYGGTFDPIHTGHLITAQAVREIRDLEKIIFIPAFISPHKTDKIHSDAKHRLNMLKMAIEDIPYFDYSDYEINNKGISFTVDTLKEIKKIYDNPIELIIGYDNILKFDTWKNPDEILELARLIVLQREVNKTNINKDKYFNSAVFVKTPVIDISATEIRSRVRQDLPINFLVTQNVSTYIKSNNLYRK